MKSPVLATCLVLAGVGLAGCSETVAPLAYGEADAYPSVGVELSPRERAVSRPVRLSNGQVALRPYSDGLPWLYGIGDVYGKASGKPTTGGVTPTVLADTPSGGFVPGQEPH